ncbi:hypothetical protein [Embleya sp. NPDC005575]|uniref:hypothetical protein n=1 Tax=Embleya sp. NPDC005575 TaxID=3156892 RepID=UPI0033B75A1C
MPDDYTWFLAHYGGGEIDPSMVIVVPDELKTTDADQEMGQETGTAHLTWQMEGGIPGVTDVPPPVLSWGVDHAPTLLCWLTIENDPNQWPVVTFNHGFLKWEIHSCGMVEFLIRVLRGEGPEDPLHGSPLWAAGTARFLNRHEASRLRSAGIDPHTGQEFNFG